ncbi:MAG: hypothetical protein RL729_533 [Actinomycetota bacterium]|jgi:hypothetical protein
MKFSNGDVAGTLLDSLIKRDDKVCGDCHRATAVRGRNRGSTRGNCENWARSRKDCENHPYKRDESPGFCGDIPHG